MQPTLGGVGVACVRRSAPCPPTSSWWALETGWPRARRGAGSPGPTGGLRRRQRVASVRARGLSAPLPQSLGHGFLGSHRSLRLISDNFLGPGGIGFREWRRLPTSGRRAATGGAAAAQRVPAVRTALTAAIGRGGAPWRQPSSHSQSGVALISAKSGPGRDYGTRDAAAIYVQAARGDGWCRGGATVPEAYGRHATGR